jgi:hypothetical protein
MRLKRIVALMGAALVSGGYLFQAHTHGCDILPNVGAVVRAQLRALGLPV